MASAFENRLRRTIEMAGTDGQTGPVPLTATPSDEGTASQTVVLTQAQYDALVVKDPVTLYLIVG